MDQELLEIFKRDIVNNPQLAKDTRILSKLPKGVDIETLTA